jgi:hypothetical protein
LSPAPFISLFLLCPLPLISSHLISFQPVSKPHKPNNKLTHHSFFFSPTNRYVTLIRFDPVYVQHFKCNIRDVRGGYPRIHAWLRNLYWNHTAFKDTTNFLHIKNHYTRSHTQINPYSITPVGPLPDILPLGEEVAAVAAAAAATGK